MTDLGWRADGIERATACGGVALEVYRRPGFDRRLAVRRVDMRSGGGPMPIETRYAGSDFAPDIEIIGRRDDPLR